MLRVYIDGACEPVNPGGTASYGLLVKFHQTGEVLYSDNRIVGSGPLMSNNVGEYSALFAFLKWFIKLQSETSDLELRSSAIIHSDSQLLINQMDGKWKIKSGLYVPYYINCCDIIREYNLRVRLFYKWIPREENVEADRLSKQAYGS